MEKEEIEYYKKAGKIAAQARDFAAKMIKEGELLVNICDKTEKFILDNDGQIAFPVQISLNEIAAHYCPTKDDSTTLKRGDVACIDVGVHVEGFIGDTAKTVEIESENGYENKELVKASLDALNKSIEYLKKNKNPKLWKIGKEIEDSIVSAGFNPVRNLSGHGLNQFEVHSYPQIPNFNNKDEEVLEDQAFAIEPFATNGVGLIEEKGTPNVFSQINNKNARGSFTRQILNQIKTYEGLPFARRWLQRNFRDSIINYGLNELNLLGVVHEYPPLVEKSKGLVSQHEHTFVLKDGKLTITTKLDED